MYSKIKLRLDIQSDRITKLKNENIYLQIQINELKEKLNYLSVKFDATANHVGMNFPFDNIKVGNNG